MYPINGYVYRHDGVSVKRISKTKARKLFNEGNVIEILPCKMIYYNHWMKPYEMWKKEGYDFDGIVGSFYHYNCNNECGYYPAFYIKEVY